MRVNLDKIAKGLGATRRGPVSAGGGYFGALQLAADVGERFRTPEGGGRPTDPSWTERRQVPLAPQTLQRLEALAATVREHGNRHLEPMQLAALLLEKAARQLTDKEVVRLAKPRRAAR